jgi:hypothetical protein
MHNVPGFPEAQNDSVDLVGSFATDALVGILIGLFVGAAVFFDYIWPERRELCVMQWIWKSLAVGLSSLQLVAR